MLSSVRFFALNSSASKLLKRTIYQENLSKIQSQNIQEKLSSCQGSFEQGCYIRRTDFS